MAKSRNSYRVYSANRSLRQQARRFTDRIFSGKGLDREGTLKLKSSPFSLIRHVLETTPIQKVELVGTPFPPSTRHFARPIPTPSTEDLDSELRWTAAILVRYASRLRPLLTLVRQVEAAVLLGDFETARVLLEHVRAEYGLSLWWMKLRLLLEDLTSGLEGNRRLKNDLAEGAPNLVLLFLHFFSQQSESSVSADDYEDTVDVFFSPDALDAKLGSPLGAYYRYRLGANAYPELEHLPAILNYEEPHALLDRYFVWCHAIRRLLGERPLTSGEELTHAIVEVADRLSDIDADFVATLASPGRVQKVGLFASLYSLLDDYTRGQYDAAHQAGLSLLTVHPYCFELYELVAKSALHSSVNDDGSLPAGSLASSIMASVSTVLRRRDTTQEQLRSLKRTACRLLSTPIAAGVAAFVRQHSSDELPLRLDRRTVLAGLVPTPRVFASLGGPPESRETLSRLSEIIPSNAAVQLFHADLTALIERAGQSAYHPDVPLPRRLRHQAYVDETCGRYEAALQAYEQMVGLVAHSPVHVADVRAGTLRCLTQLGRVAECLRILAESCARQPHLISGAMLQGVIAGYNVHDAKTCVGDIGWPIVVSTAQLLGTESHDPDRLHDFLDDFLTAHDCRRPSELQATLTDFEQAELIVLFRDVCSTAVLQSSIWYDSQEDVEQERIKLCRWLIEHDKSAVSRYQDEIAELSRRAAIRDLVREADRSRVYVDTAGIERGVPEVTRERAFRCVTLFLLRDERLRKCLDLAGIDLSTLSQGRVVFLDEGFTLFKTIFAELKDAFLGSTQYGLDANLSQRIRHGTLAGEIRAHFEEHRLVTHMAGQGEYVEPVFWRERIGPSSQDEWTQSAHAFGALSRDVDSLIAEVRNEWIQLRSDSGPTAALFDYDFSEDDLYSAYSSLPVDIGDDTSGATSAVFKTCFDALWERTEQNLTRVRDAVLVRLRDRLFLHIQEFEQKLSDALGHDRTVDVRTATANCRTAVGIGLQSIAEWFRSGAKQRVPDCRFAHLADALVRVVSQYCGPTHVECIPAVDDDLIVPGHAFRGIWDILFILLDNAAKHSGGASTVAGVTVVQGPTHLSITVTNGVDPSVPIEQLRASASALSAVENGTDDLSAARKEGGSGYTKLHKILRYDLACSDYRITASVTAESMFVVNVTLNPGWNNDASTIGR